MLVARRNKIFELGFRRYLIQLMHRELSFDTKLLIKLRAKSCMPASSAVFGHYLAIKWPNFNILDRTFLYET